MSKKQEHVGVIVVHGIGEQRRFEHLDWQVRCIVGALRKRPNAKLTVEIAEAPIAAFHAEHDTWGSGPSVRVLLDDPQSGKLIQIHFHEVWWADVNEPYSLAKQLRFWLWGLTVWIYPGKIGTTLPTAGSVQMPSVAGRTTWETLANKIWLRTRLLAIGFVAIIAAASVGMVTFLAERVLNLRAPNIVRLFVNYVAGVKLYNQKKRFGAGFPLKPQDFLDTLEEPPRVSIRRRMLRAIMDISEGVKIGEEKRPYTRWYVLAHSLGSIVAFNGLMETAYAWPGYFDEKRWRALRADGKAGPATRSWKTPAPTEITSPARPVWVGPRDVAYRSRVFKNFHGLLTFGSPLEKFAAIWPARVPISKEPAFRAGTVWLNIFDPIDPVSGSLRSFDVSDTSCCPNVQNVGYASGNVLLLNHLQYLNGPYNTGTLADGVAEWLVTGNAHQISVNAGPRWFAPTQFRYWQRGLVAWIWWILAVLSLSLLGAIVLPNVVSALDRIFEAVWRHVGASF